MLYPLCITNMSLFQQITKYFNENDFIQHLSQCPFDKLLKNYDPDETLLSFINIFTEVLYHAPLIKIELNMFIKIS